MVIKRQDLLNVLNKMQVNSIEKVNFKDNLIYQYENDILIKNEIFKENLQENFSLPLQQLITILTKLKDEEIELLVEDVIKIKSKKSEIEFSKSPILKDFTFDNDYTWIDLPDNFIKGIQFANNLIDTNNQRFNPVVFIDNDKIVSTDGKALIIYNLGIDFNKFFLTQSQINLLLKFDIKQYYLKDNLIYFLGSDSSVIYFNYLIDMKFVPYEKIVLENEKEIKFLDKLNLNDIDLNNSILDSESKILKVQIDKNNIIIKSTNNNISIKTKLDKENIIDNNILFGINSDYLLFFLKSEYSDNFKVYIDETKICFMNKYIKFITTLMDTK
jgi:hypothetical protein